MSSFPHALDLFNRGRLDEAEAICREIVRKQKRDVNAWQLLGMIHGRRGWYDKAVPCYQTCIRLAPNEPIGYVRLATARMYQGRFDDARKQFDKALALRAAFLPAMTGMAELLEREERVQEAHDLLAPVVADHPEDAEAALLFAGLQAKTGARNDAIETIRRTLTLPRVQPVTRRKLLFALGRTLDRIGRHDDAFAAWAEGNRTAGRAWDPAQADAVTDRLAGVFSAEAMPGFPRAAGASGTSARPVFIVGMPRSGSTLVEQIIDAHPRAFGAGEIAAFNSVIAAVERQAERDVRYPEAVRELTASALDATGRGYLDHLARLAPRDAERVADKNLLNFKHLGLIALVYPSARVIHCRRDPLDNCLSCFMNDLPPIGFPWAGDLEHIGRFHAAYERLMAHWHAVLDLPILDVQYEALVADQERVTRDIVEFCGLPWDDACLHFHETRRAVRTISYDQVRQPIYRTAVQRWERYAAHLGPLRSALGIEA